MQESMTARPGLFRSAADALLLRDRAFAAVLDEPRPFVRGLVFVLVVALVVALAGVVGTGLSQWTSPDLDQIRGAVVEGLEAMPWRDEIAAKDIGEVDESIDRTLDIVFGIMGMLAPTLPKALAALVLMPLAMMFTWLVFGLIVHVVASVFEGEASLSQTYGAIALAAAPQLLGVVNVLPYIETAGLTLWSVMCAYLAVKHVHGLSANRAFWAMLLSLAVAGVLASVFGIGVGLVVALSSQGIGGAGL